jgi:hypothetical protein
MILIVMVAAVALIERFGRPDAWGTRPEPLALARRIRSGLRLGPGILILEFGVQLAVAFPACLAGILRRTARRPWTKWLAHRENSKETLRS